MLASLYSFFTRKYVPELLVLLIYIVVQVGLYFKLGTILHHYDTQRYVNYANDILAGNMYYHHNFWYGGYVILLVFLYGLGLSNTAVVVVQMIIGGFAVAAQYDTARMLSGKRSVGILAAIILAAWVRLQWWNCYVLTESFFTSACVILFWALVRQHKRPANLLLLLPAVLFVSWIRPVGIIVLGSYVLLLTRFAYKALNISLRTKLLALLTLCSLFIFWGLNWVLQEHFYLIGPYAQGQIVCGFTDWLLEAKRPIKLPRNEWLPFVKIAYFIWHNPIYFMRLVLYKVSFSLSGLRPTYSTLHNILLLLLQVPQFILFPLGFTKLTWRLQAYKWYLFPFIVGHILLIAFTCANWNSRFITPVLPAIFITTAMLIEVLYKKIAAITYFKGS